MRKSKVCVVVPMLLVAVMVTTEKLKVVGVPEMVAVPLVLALKVNPLGRAPVSASVAVGEPVVVTVKVEALPTVGVTRELLVNFGGVPMVMVKACVTEPLALVAVRVRMEVPAVVGVPEMVAVPLVLALKVNPAGRAPVSASVAVGEPVVVTVKVEAFPTVSEVEAALVNLVAVPITIESVAVVVPLAFLAVRVSVEVPAVVGVPVMVAVPSPLLVKRTPVGTVPVSVMAAVGEPVVVTVKENAVPTTPVAEPALVNFGATGAAVTVNP